MYSLEDKIKVCSISISHAASLRELSLFVKGILPLSAIIFKWEKHSFEGKEACNAEWKTHVSAGILAWKLGA
jgi:hypothetical protein